MSYFLFHIRGRNKILLDLILNKLTIYFNLLWYLIKHMVGSDMHSGLIIRSWLQWKRYVTPNVTNANVWPTQVHFFGALVHSTVFCWAVYCTATFWFLLLQDNRLCSTKIEYPAVDFWSLGDPFYYLYTAVIITVTSSHCLPDETFWMY